MKQGDGQERRQDESHLDDHTPGPDLLNALSGPVRERHGLPGMRVPPPNALRFCCRGVRRQPRVPQQNLLARLRRATAPVSSKRGLGGDPTPTRATGALGGRVVVRTDPGSATSALRARREAYERRPAKGWVGWSGPEAGWRAPTPMLERGGTRWAVTGIRRRAIPSGQARSGTGNPWEARRGRGTTMLTARAGRCRWGGARRQDHHPIVDPEMRVERMPAGGSGEAT